ncbi:MAG: DUF6266 family protein [Candidatus Pedobacter colombiensis]|uniref:DUF6266 family protein n=1 Tax=Candidatus Pedobacter colombiensis TaxID=3121371 RepID=A0AAJ5WBE4_9SPHI|nr:DUF6266 family protein [Pedobacter sp.]WEK20923.1 MAG: DUF6266 family protein [Pedobacter sp.]
MGIIRQGILGGFRKKTGTVVGAFWRDLNVIRALPRASKKAATQLQINQRLRFGLIMGFLSSFSDLIEMYYNHRSATKSPMNEAVSYHLKEAVIGVGPNFTIDYPKVKFSRGKLVLPAAMQVGATATATVDFEWNHTVGDNRFRDATDLVNLLVYNPTKKQFVTLMEAAPRSAEVYSLQLPIEFSGDNIHCYMNFSSALKKGVASDSFYVGMMKVV